MIFNINRTKRTKLSFYHCDLFSASFKLDLPQQTLLFLQVNLHNRIIFASLIALKYDRI